MASAPALSRPNMSVLVLLLLFSSALAAGHDYAKALQKSILFFEAQRSGVLPSSQRVTWRANSGLQDGKTSGVDLVGGYYDAGDNVKFGLPMAFTVTMMSWSILEYGRQMGKLGELGHAMEAIKWGTDYLIKAHPEPYVLYGEVGDGNTDHYCWQRPEEMTTSRAAYRIDVNHPGSDLAGETAAAMAAASMVFKRSNPAYAGELLTHAKQLFEFADKYRGKYDASITVAQKYYRSYSGYADELLWAAAWMYQATDDASYLDYLATNADALGGTGWSMREFGWDVKYAGVQVLAAKFLLQGKVTPAHAPTFERYREKAEYFLCACMGKAGGSGNVQRTPGGLLFRQRWNNLQFVSTASFLLTAYGDYLQAAGKSAGCAQGAAGPEELIGFAKTQVDYVLGDNPRATSYMVGYGNSWPQQVHHRGASIVSYKVNPAFVTCRGGYDTWFTRKASDPNLLVGAIVGGPDAYDNFADERDNYEQTEPATYNNAPVMGVLARLAAGNGGYNQLLPVMVPATAVAPAASASGLNQVPTAPTTTSPVTAAVTTTSGDVAVEQRVTASWEAKGKTYYRYSVLIKNNSGKTVRDIRVTVSNIYGPVWGLQKTTASGSDYSFPSWLPELPAGKSLEFVYIHAAPQADVSVSKYTLA